MLTESINTALLDGDNERVYEMIFGDTDPDTLEFSLEHFIANELKARPIDLLFFELSVSAVFGIQLSNSSSIVFKFFPESYGKAHLDAVVKTQMSLFESGFPCPKPITQCHSLCSAIGYAEELVEEGTFQEKVEKVSLNELAKGQHTIHTMLQNVDAKGLKRFLIPREGEESDELAKKAQELVCAHEPRLIVGHGEWGFKCTRFESNKLVAAFDWYSLVAEDELVLLGVAAASHWQSPYGNSKIEPNLPLMKDYVEAYQNARGRPFNFGEKLIINAAMAYRLVQLSLPKLAQELISE